MEGRRWGCLLHRQLLSKLHQARRLAGHRAARGSVSTGLGCGNGDSWPPFLFGLLPALPPGDTSPFPGGTAQSHVQDLPQWWSLLTSQGSPHPCHCGWRNPLGWWGLCFPGSHVATSSLSLGPQPPGNPPLDGLKLSAAVSDRTARMYLWFQRP